MFTFLLSAAVCASFGLRPDARHFGASSSLSRLGDVIDSAAHSKGSKSLESLKSAASIVNTIMLQAGNATEHMSDDDTALLNSVIDMIGKSIYGSMDSSHQTDGAAIQAAVDAVSKCNSDIALRLGENGDLTTLNSRVAGYQQELNGFQEEIDAATDVNNTKFHELQTHINNIGNSPDCDEFPNTPTKLKADNFFAGNEYVDWYTSRQQAYAPFAEALDTSDAILEDAIADYGVGLAQRDVAYCDWKVELEGGCAAFDQCYLEKVDYYNNQLKPALQQDMAVRVDAYKAGETIIAQIQFLLGLSTESDAPTDIDTSRFQLTFLPVPAKGECSLSPLDSEEWVPAPDCSGEKKVAEGCGSIRSDPDASPPSGWKQCYIDQRDTQHLSTPCDVVVAAAGVCGGAAPETFGCWHGTTGATWGAAFATNGVVEHSCRAGRQQSTRLDAWNPTTTTLGICVKCRNH